MKVIRANWTEKLLALVLAVFMWASGRGRQGPIEARWDADLAVRNLPNGIVVVARTTKVRFVVRGERQDVRRLKDTLAPYVDLAGAGPGTHSFDVFYRLSGGVDVQHIDTVPPRARFQLDRVTSRRLGVLVDVTGTLQDGYSLGARRVTPVEVVVRGRQGLLAQIAAAVAAVNVGDPASPIQETPVRLLNSSGREIAGLSPDPARVKVTLEFLEQEASADVPIRQTTTGRVATGAVFVAIRLNPQSVPLKGRADLLREVREIRTEAIGLSGLRETTNRRVRLVIPPGLRAATWTTVATIVVEPAKPERQPDDHEPEAAGKGKAKAPPKPTGKGETGDPDDAGLHPPTGEKG
jgi:YbbR domain-containing protein